MRRSNSSDAAARGTVEGSSSARGSRLQSVIVACSMVVMCFALGSMLSDMYDAMGDFAACPEDGHYATAGEADARDAQWYRRRGPPCPARVTTTLTSSAATSAADSTKHSASTQAEPLRMCCLIRADMRKHSSSLMLTASSLIASFEAAVSDDADAGATVLSHTPASRLELLLTSTTDVGNSAFNDRSESWLHDAAAWINTGAGRRRRRRQREQRCDDGASWDSASPLSSASIVHLRDMKVPPEEMAHADQFGFLLTDYALTHAVRRQRSAACTHFIVTNGDNIYGVGFFRAVLAEIAAGKRLVGVDFVSRYTQHTWTVQRFTLGTTDLGSVAFSAGLLANRSFFRGRARQRMAGDADSEEKQQGRHFFEATSDAEFIRGVAEALAPSEVARVGKLLFFHQ